MYERHEVTTPRGHPAVMLVRPGTSDLATVGSTFGGVVGSGLVDEYRLAGMRIAGCFLDVGAHIGSVAVAVLLDNPDAWAVCVEPLPENVDLIRANLEANGLADRCSVAQGAVGTAVVRYSADPTHRYIGNIVGDSAESVTVRDLGDIIETLEPLAAVKTDCEGGEWALLDTTAASVVPLIFGEAHGSEWQRHLAALLGTTHDIDFADETTGTGLFWAYRRETMDPAEVKRRIGATA